MKLATKKQALQYHCAAHDFMTKKWNHMFEDAQGVAKLAITEYLASCDNRTLYDTTVASWQEWVGFDFYKAAKEEGWEQFNDMPDLWNKQDELSKTTIELVYELKKTMI